MNWTTPADLIAQVERLWDSRRLLKAIVAGEELFPFTLRLRCPQRAEMVERFAEVQSWIQALDAGGKGKRGFGYELAWADINHRQLGRNRVPEAASIPTEDDALRLIGKDGAAAKFRELARVTLERFPILKDWIARRPFALLDHAADWDAVLAVVAWFQDHEHSNLYLRQIDIPGVDTKFIETRKSLLSELMGQVLAVEGADDAGAGAGNFERRYGLRTKPALLRFRILDPLLKIGGLSDLSVPAAEFAALETAATRVFVTENEINGLAFPDAQGSIVVFGLGYGLDLLLQAKWLGDRALHYWGDIDTHGFVMLDRLRAGFPHAQSLLMDQSVLAAHRAQWVRETSPHRGELGRLTPAEGALYEELRHDRLGQGVRLEQERIAYGWVRRAIATTAEAEMG
jgi:hypothetical protein